MNLKSLKRKKTLAYSGLSLGILTLALSGAYFFWKGNEIQRENFWKTSLEPDQSSKDFTLKDTKILKDYFLADRFKGMVEYKLYLQSQGPKNWDQLLRKTLQEMTFSTKSYPPTPTPRPFFLERFMKSLKTKIDHNVQNKNWPASYYQTDLVVEPEYHYNLDPDSTLTDNHYLSYEQINEYHEYLEEAPKPFGKRIHELYLPHNGRTYQFKGGVISLVFPGPKTFAIAPGGEKANAKIRYRKYYKLNRKDDLNIDFDSGLLGKHDVSIEYLHFQDNSESQFHLTVDHVKWFKLGSPSKVSAEYLVFTPGKILSPIARTSFHRSPASTRELTPQDYKTGRMYLRGKYQGMPFETELKKIFFDLKKEEFLFEDTSVETVFKGGKLSYETTSEVIQDKESFLMERARAKSHLKHLFIQDHSAHIYEDLKFNRFIKGER